MIPFTQYLRPNGEAKPVEIERPLEIEGMANFLIKLGYRFEIEEMMTGIISMTIEHPFGSDEADEGSLAHFLCTNGPEVPESVDKMIKQAYEMVKGEKNGNS